MTQKRGFGAGSRHGIVAGPARSSTKSFPLRSGARWVLVVCGYYLAARLGLLIPYVGTHVSLVWLPTGIALAAILRWGGGMTTAVFAGAMWANATIGGPLWLAAGIGFGNSVGPWIATLLLRHWQLDNRLLRRRDMLAFLGAVLLGMTVTATNGTCWLRVAGLLDEAHWAGAWSTWWIGDSVGALLSGITLVAINRAALKQSFAGGAGLVNAGVQGLALSCGIAVFSPFLTSGSALLFPLLALPFFLIPLLALRGGVVNSSLAVLLLSMAAAYGTSQGHGPFAQQDAQAGILALWSYITAQACTALLICGMATELQSTKRQFSAVVQHAHDAIVIIGPTDAVVAVNPSAMALLELQHSGMVGMPISSLPHGNGRVLADWLLSHQDQDSEDLQLQRADGSILPVECQVSRYRDASGLWQTHVMLSDLSARKQAEQKLAASEARLKAVTDNLPALIAYVDRTTTYRFANAHFKLVMGIDPQDLVGQTMCEFLGEDAYAALRPHVEAALTGDRRKFERTGWSRNADIHFLVDYVPDFDSEGHVAGFFIMVLDITERRRAELALERSERRIRTIADNLPAMISHFDRDLRYTFANAKVGEVFGCSSESLLGRSIREVRGEDIYADVSPKMARALAGEPISFEATATVNGLPEHFEANYIPEITATGEVLGFYALTFEVTSRKEAEKKLHASQQLLDRTGTLAGVGGWELDIESSRIRWTNQTRRIHEVDDDYVPTVEDAIGFYIGAARQTIQQAVEFALENGTPWDVELPFLTAKKRSIWVRATGEVEFENGKPVRLFGAFQDVTDRVMKAQQMRDQTELLQVTLKSIGDAVITTDASGNITWMNPVAERLTGWLEGEAKGRALPQVFHIVNQNTRELALDPVLQCLQDGKTVGLANHTLLLSRNGGEFGIEDSAAPIRSGSGEVLGVVLVFHDVSEQRRLSGEMSYRATHDALTGLVNRAEFEARLQRLLQKSYEDDSEHALLYIDLDQFKLVNDACGHAVGDQLLQQVSKLLGGAIRNRDTLARLGGDEFAIIMEHCTSGQALRVAEKICQLMDDFRFIHDERRFRIGTSIGLVPVDKRWATTAAIQQAADTSCYAAKEAGRNRVHAWFDTDATMRARHLEMQWTTRIEQALDEDRFTLFAQRIEPLTGDATGLHAEVLLRMKESDGSLVLPGAFLPAAERFPPGFACRQVGVPACRGLDGRLSRSFRDRFPQCESFRAVGWRQVVPPVGTRPSFQRRRLDLREALHRGHRDSGRHEHGRRSRLHRACARGRCESCPRRFRRRGIVVWISQDVARRHTEDRWSVRTRSPGRSTG